MTLVSALAGKICCTLATGLALPIVLLRLPGIFKSAALSLTATKLLPPLLPTKQRI